MQKNYFFRVMAIAMIFLFSANWGFAQTNPATATLPVSFTSQTGATLPTFMAIHRFGTTSGAIPTTRTTIDGNADLPNTSLNGSGGWIAETNDGLSILASGSNAAGAILFEFSTTGKENIQVSAIRWTKLDQTFRTMSIALQYRIGDSGTWIDVDSPSSSVYSTGIVGRANGVSDTQNLPVSTNNKPIVQIRWIYWESNAGTGGSRDRLGLDEVSITGTDISTTPALSLADLPNITEGNSGTTDAVFTITSSIPAPVGGITFDIATADLTPTTSATAGTDYVASPVLGVTSLTIPANQTSITFNVTINSDTDIEPNETFSVNISNAVGATIADAQAVGTIINDDFELIKIHAIQGSGSESTMLGTRKVQGIVTRTFFGAGSLNGFYLQEEDADIDGDPLTSEGIFVYNPTVQPTVGDNVTVTGTVIEFGTTIKLTEISPAILVEINSNSNQLPIPINVTLPVANVSDLERYEGMLVNLKAATGNLVVTNNFDLGRYGQIVLAADEPDINAPGANAPGTDARIDQYTQFNLPSVAGNSAYLEAIKKRTIYVDDANTLQNIDPIKFGRGGMPLTASNTLRTGDEVESVTAVLDQRFEGYRLQIGASSELNIIPTNVRPTSPNLTGNPTLVVGNMNVLNYFNGDGMGGGFPTARGAQTPAEFTMQRDKIIAAIIGSGADVLSLNEMENDGYEATSAIQDLINGLNAASSPGTWQAIIPATGTITATDAITCAMIYKPAKVIPEGNLAALLTGEYEEVGRAAIAQTFKQLSNNALVTLVGGHFKSKGSLNAGLGNTDSGDG